MSGKKSHEKKVNMYVCIYVYIRSEKCLAKNGLKKSDKNECKNNRDEAKRKKPARESFNIDNKINVKLMKVLGKEV